MRRLLISILCIALVAGAFAGCGGNKPDTTQATDATTAAAVTTTVATAAEPVADTGSDVSDNGADAVPTSAAATTAAVTTAAAPAEPATEPPAEAATGAAYSSRTHYREMYGGEITTMNYLITGNQNEHYMAANMVDCLIEYDKYGIIKPSLATSWQPNSDYTVWTFKIREGVKWVDVDGNEVAEVTAHDWVAAAKYVNTAEFDSSLQYMYDGIILNAEDYYEQTADELDAANAVADGAYASVEEYYIDNDINPDDFIPWEDVGVKALDDYTLEYTMEVACPFFPSVLSYASYMPAYGPFLDQYGVNFGLDNYSILYNGAYIMTTFEPQRTRILTKNPTYWDAGQVYIDTVELIYNAQSSTLAPTMFQRGEIDGAVIGIDILDEWLKNPETANMVRPSTVEVDYSYFMAFNFEPRFDAEYEPENWIKAVNNENFRQALRSAFDRVKALTVTDAENPQLLLNNTLTPANFAIGGGKDYTQYGTLKQYTDGDSFDPAAAIAFRDKARAELEAEGATFPIKALMPYNPVATDWDLECQVIQQQIESLLGSDFIKIIVEAGPSTGFLAAVRRTGSYAFMKCNWGADYADPQTWTDPMSAGNSYNFMYTDEKKVLSDIPAINKSEETQRIVFVYYDMVDEAKSIVADEAARYEAFADAEAYLLSHAMIIPFCVSSSGYVADYLNPFDRQYAPYGMSILRYKGRRILEKPMNTPQFEEAKANWEAERAAAAAAAR